MKSASKLRETIHRIAARALNEARPSEDPIVADCAGALIHALVVAIQEEDAIGDTAWEVMMGSMPDEERLALGRYEDVDAFAELIVRDTLRDAALHDALHDLASSMLRGAMESVQDTMDTIAKMPPEHRGKA